MIDRLQVTFETISCPACGHPEHTVERQVRDRFDVIPGKFFVIVRCRECRLLYLNPRPDAESVSLFYQASGYDPFVSSRRHGSALVLAYRVARTVSVRRKASRVVHGLAPGARTLDVGCATGEFMVELQRRGFAAYGVEPDPGAAEYARKQNGLSVWTGSIHSVPPDAAPFDLITFWHVIEHVHDLRDVLERAKNLLSPEGRLAIAVPNPIASDAKSYGDEWVAWDTPRHLYHFEPAVMLSLLSRAGFHARRAGAVAFDAFYHSLLSEKKTIRGFLRGGARGLASFVRGVAGADGSSELYLAYKRL